MMKETTKKLRSCSAHVNTRTNDWGIVSHMLVSYNTPVCALGILDGEIVNDYTGEVINTCGELFIILRSGWYDYSITTMQHVRKFLADYYGENLTIAQLRKMALDPDTTHVIVIDW